MQYLCRDCTKLLNINQIPSRCGECGSPRILAHEELEELNIAHFDCDSFFASVEKRDNKELIDKPVIIGGGKRGVVATCCYIARQSGIHSAMPIMKAKKLCPNAVIIPPNMAKYKYVSKQIFALMQPLTPLFEPLSIDEGFLDFSGTRKLHKACAAQILAKIALKIEEQIGVSISVGLSHNKFLAKLASDLDKPRGFSIIGKKEAKQFLAPLPISKIYGVGKKFAAKLKKDGFINIGQLQKYPKSELIKNYGELGATLADLARAKDRRRVKSERKVKSVSTEITFSTDIADFSTLSTILLELAERVSFRLKQKRLIGDIITLKLKSANFELRTRAKHISFPTHFAHIIYEIGEQLLAKEVDGTNFRLIGIGVSSLLSGIGEIPSDLLEPKIYKKAKIERAMDILHEKFGKKALIRGKLYQIEDKLDI